MPKLSWEEILQADAELSIENPIFGNSIDQYKCTPEEATNEVQLGDSEPPKPDNTILKVPIHRYVKKYQQLRGE